MTIHREPWPPGTPAWADLMTPDRTRAREFYRGLLGWEYGPESPAEMGYYTMALKHGEQVVGIGEPLPGDESPTAYWSVYLATDDAAASLEAAEAAGAKVVAPVTPVEGFGTMAVFADPTGALVGLWQSGSHTGTNVVGEAGTLLWAEQMSRDLPAAEAFYTAVFGYTYTDASSPEFRYDAFEVAGETAGGIGQISEQMPGGVAAWSVYFGADNVDAAAAYVSEHGGTVLRQPWDTEYGRIALVSGPGGEVFSLMTPPPPGAAG